MRARYRSDDDDDLESTDDDVKLCFFMRVLAPRGRRPEDCGYVRRLKIRTGTIAWSTPIGSFLPFFPLLSARPPVKTATARERLSVCLSV